MNRSILVVEDDPFMRLYMVEYLNEQKFEVYEASDAEAALAILEAMPDLQIVVTDVQMPGAMDGKALAHYVRSRLPPTILIVASGTEELSEADLPARSAFLAKPFRPAALLSAIEQLMAQSNQNATIDAIDPSPWEEAARIVESFGGGTSDLLTELLARIAATLRKRGKLS